MSCQQVGHRSPSSFLNFFYHFNYNLIRIWVLSYKPLLVLRISKRLSWAFIYSRCQHVGSEFYFTFSFNMLHLFLYKAEPKLVSHLSLSLAQIWQFCVVTFSSSLPCQFCLVHCFAFILNEKPTLFRGSTQFSILNWMKPLTICQNRHFCCTLECSCFIFCWSIQLRCLLIGIFIADFLTKIRWKSCWS